eukprot:g1865.t1
MNSSATVDGDLLSVTSWNARTLTNVSWEIPWWRRNSTHLIVVTWDEEATEETWWPSDPDDNSRAESPPSTVSSSTYLPSIGEDLPVPDLCTYSWDAFDSQSDDAFGTDANRALVSVDLADGRTWWFTASLDQDRPNATSPTSEVGQASVLLSEPGFYMACLLLVVGLDETCPTEECVDFTVYQPPYDLLEVESTNIGHVVTVRFNLASRRAYSGDWGWVLGEVDPSLTLEEANSLSAADADYFYDERCWFYFGRAVELGQTFMCSSQPDPLLASFQNTPTLRAYQYGRFEMYLTAAGNGSLWFGESERYTYTMVTNFYTCGVTVQPLNSTTVTTTTDLVVTAVPEHGEMCDVGDGIELELRSGEVSANIEDVEAWIYFTGRVVSISSEETSISVRFAYKGEHMIMISLASGATLDILDITVVAADPYAPSCEGKSAVTERPPSSSPEGSSVLVSFSANDFYGNSISEPWGSDSFQAWSYTSVGNTTPATVHDDGNGSYRVVSEALEFAGTGFLFVERNGLGIPGSPFEVYVFGPATCAVVSSVGDCQSNLERPVSQEWAANSPCLGRFEQPVHASVACGSVPAESDLGTTIVVFAVFAGLYAGVFLWWIRRNRQTVIVKLSQPFVCQLLLVGCILLNITATLYVGVPSDVVCLARPWMTHVGLTFTSGCLYMKTYRVHRIFNSASKLSRISISDRQLVGWVLRLVAVDVTLLLTWTLVDRPRRVHSVELISSGVEVTSSKCWGGSDFPVFDVILWSWKAGLTCFGVVMAAKTWHCEDGVGESQQICVSVYNTALLGLVNLAITVFLADSAVIGQGGSAFTLIGGTVFALSILFAPKVYKLWRHGDLSPNPVERRSSVTMTTTTQSYGRRGSTAGTSASVPTPTGAATVAAGTKAAGRRKSSSTLNLNFVAVGKEKIVPINEERNAEGEKEEEGAVKDVTTPYEKSSISKCGSGEDEVCGAVFEVHGNRLVYSRSSLYLFGQGSRVRLACVQTAAHPWFERLVLLLILLNSIVLALVDWSAIDEDPSSEDVGEPIAEGSWRNTLLYETEIFFTVMFALEFVLKVIAQGFVFGRGAYLRDSWNVIDFLVVVTSLLASIPGMPTTSAIRVFRVLRPLRSISALPGLQRLVVSLLRSVPQLVSVIALLQFIFIVFGTFGIQIFAGKQHSRCRLTPYPVTTAFEGGMDYADHRCLEVSNFDTVDDESSWTQSTSPWSTPRECYWPLDTDDTRLCAFDSSSGDHKCDHDPLYLNETDFRWCGSDYDALGNRRFSGGVIGGVEWSAADLAANATFVEDLAWGYTTFDNIFKAFLTIFQSITLEGWSDILYQAKDCSLPVLADLFFIILVLWGAFFTLNLLLAVLEANFSQGKDSEKEQQGRSAEAAVDKQTANVNAHLAGDVAVTGAAAQERAIAAEQKVGDEDLPADIAGRLKRTRFIENREEGADVESGTKAERGWSQGASERRFCSKQTRSRSSSSSSESEDGRSGWRLTLRRVASNKKFQRSVTVLIILNTLVLALDHHPMDQEFSTALEACNLAFTLCFALEMAIKLVAMGPREYAEDRSNIFDAVIVVSSLVELLLLPPDILTGGTDGDVGGSLSALRSFRVFRVFKLARGWSSMRDLLETLRKTLMDLGNFGLLLLLFMFVYILIGVQFFANRFHFGEDGKAIGIGEEGYFDAEVLSGDNWNSTMYNAQRAVGWVSVFYFVSLIVLGMFIVMSLFLAILLSHFSTPEEHGVDTKEGDKHQRQRAQQHHRDNTGVVEENRAEEPRTRRKQQGVYAGAWNGGKHTHTCQPKLSSQDSDDDHDNGPATLARLNPAAVSRALSRTQRAASVAPRSSVGGRRFSNDHGDDDDDDDDSGNDDNDNGTKRARFAQQKQHKDRQQQPSNNDVVTAKQDAEGDAAFALCCLSANHPLRRGCLAIIRNAWFDRFIMLLIVISSVELAVDNPLLDPDSTTSRALEVAELVITVLFTAEFLLKVFASGFLFIPRAYLRDPWNVLDFVVVVISISQLFVTDGSGSAKLGSLRALRVLRPLRIINRLPGLKLVLEVLVHSVPGVLNVAAVCFMFFIIFAILSVHYFKGVLMSCQGDDFDALPATAVEFLESPLPWSEMTAEQRGWFGPMSNVSEATFSWSEDECVVVSGGLWPDAAGCCSEWPSSAEEAPTSFEVCECLGLEWAETIPQQFNNVAVALRTLFEVSTTWTSVTYAAVDSTSEDMQPIRDYALSRVWFFILFMLIGAYLVLNLFVGVVVDNFKKMSARAEGGLFATDNQRSWTKTQLIMHRLKPTRRRHSPTEPVGAWCFRLVHRPWFDPTVMVLIVLNTVVMAMEYFGQSTTYTRVLEGLNYTFFVIFALEALVKILALRRAYFTDAWNRFDLFVVAGSAAGLLAVWLVGSSYGSIATIIRIFRVGRVLRLVRGLESMAQLFRTLVMTLPSLGNVGCLLFLLFFVYAALGEQLYAKVGLNGAVTSQANFRSFWDSMVLLLRFSTGENWNGFMYDLAADRDGCVKDPEYDPDVCGFTSHANCVPLNGCGSWSIFPYMISFTFIITFVFLNLFIGVILDGFGTAKEESEGFITQEDFSRFADHWAKFDPHATCLMSVPDLHAFLQTLFKPWGFGVDYQASQREVRQKVLKLDLHVYDDNRVHFRRNTIGSWKRRRLGSGYMVNPVSNTTITFDQILAIEFLQQAFRRKVAERKRREAEAKAPSAMGAGSRVGATAINNPDKAFIAVPPFVAPEDGADDDEAKRSEGVGIELIGEPVPGSE